MLKNISTHESYDMYVDAFKGIIGTCERWDLQSWFRRALRFCMFFPRVGLFKKPDIALQLEGSKNINVKWGINSQYSIEDRNLKNNEFVSV